MSFLDVKRSTTQLIVDFRTVIFIELNCVRPHRSTLIDLCRCTRIRILRVLRWPSSKEDSSTYNCNSDKYQSHLGTKPFFCIRRTRCTVCFAETCHIFLCHTRIKSNTFSRRRVHYFTQRQTLLLLIQLLVIVCKLMQQPIELFHECTLRHCGILI
ncbi:hypothetical protein YQ44_03695 [Janthinobacterium sp. 1_2014MBL_MicDiv]|nr:hypothetical protein YQ44_03695 [Janthinobacterium sp. 1_2014MBL_MicDiv]